MEEALRRKLLADADGMGDDRRLITLSRMVLNFFKETDVNNGSSVAVSSADVGGGTVATATSVENNGKPKTSASVAASEASLRKMQNLIHQGDIAMKKATLLNRVTDEETTHYEAMSAKIVEDIAVAQQRINECKRELQDAKQIRKQKQEYDALAALIKKHPARTETYNRLEALKQQMKTAAEKRDRCVEQLDNRKKQLHVLLISLQELSAMVKSDSALT